MGFFIINLFDQVMLYEIGSQPILLMIFFWNDKWDMEVPQYLFEWINGITPHTHTSSLALKIYIDVSLSILYDKEISQNL